MTRFGTFLIASLQLVACLLGASFATIAASQQRMVQIPDSAQRAEMSFQGSNEVVIDGRTQARMAPGVRIFGRDNMLVMWGGLTGQAIVRYTLEPMTGLVQSIWILTEEEIARPDPKPAR
ncbi:MAG: hypothetical protein ACKVQQ_17130 [Burkholderiales bacterium]